MKNSEQVKKSNADHLKEKLYLLRLLEKRWSPRSFSDEKIPPETIEQIFKAGSQIMSCFNEQPWRIIFSTNGDEHHQKLFECLIDFNQMWVKTAPHLGVVFGKKHFTEKDKVNKHRFYDSGGFMAIATLYATSLGLYMHQMAGFSPEKVASRFDIPDEYEPITMFVLGKKDNPEKLPDDLQEMEDADSERKGTDRFLFGGTWGEPYLSFKKDKP